jgi:regulator of RNase E activity RraA
MVGSALTVKTRPGDNLYVYGALHILRAGEVLVVDAGGSVENAIVGELLQLYASARGCAGFVIDGAIRDIAAFESADFPCYARGVSHRGPFKTGPGRLNVPVSIGGQVISPGDIVVGDEDGIVSFALSDAEKIVATAQAKARNELAIKAEIATGERDQSWLSPFLLPEEPQRS